MRVSSVFQACSFAALALVTGYATAAASEGQGSSESAAEVFADGLWAGQTTLTMER